MLLARNRAGRPNAALWLTMACCLCIVSGARAQLSNASPLTVVCPPNSAIRFLTETGTVATFTASVTGGCSQATITFTPASGSLFPIGTTPVSLLVTDACSSVQCFFNLTVLGPRDIKSTMLADVLALQFAAKSRVDRKGLDKVIRHLTAALNADSWVDQTHIVTNRGSSVFSHDRGAVGVMHLLQTSGKSDLSDDTLQKFMDALAASGRLIAATRIQEASATSSNSTRIAQARVDLLKGDDEFAKKHDSTALGRYQTAWSRVSKL